MRYSSHLYLRTDGTLGRYPIVEVDSHGCIVSIRECGDTLVEMASTRFFSGIMIPGLIACGEAQPAKGYLHSSSHEGDNPMLTFNCKEELIRKVHELSAERAISIGVYPERGAIEVGSTPGLVVIENVPLDTFDGRNARLRILC